MELFPQKCKLGKKRVIEKKKSENGNLPDQVSSKKYQSLLFALKSLGFFKIACSRWKAKMNFFGNGNQSDRIFISKYMHKLWFSLKSAESFQRYFFPGEKRVKTDFPEIGKLSNSKVKIPIISEFCQDR